MTRVKGQPCLTPPARLAAGSETAAGGPGRGNNERSLTFSPQTRAASRQTDADPLAALDAALDRSGFVALPDSLAAARAAPDTEVHLMGEGSQ